MASSEILTVTEAAKRLRVSKTTVQIYFNNGLLDGYRLPSGFRRIYAESVAAMLAERSAP